MEKLREVVKKSLGRKSFTQQLIDICQQKKSSLFLGIDPHTEYIPRSFRDAFETNEKKNNEKYGELWYEYFSFVIETLNPFIAGIKLQSAYFEVLGAVGIKTMRLLAKKAKEQKLLVLFDGKRADIPSTSQAYAKAYLENCQENEEQAAQNYWGSSIDGMTTHPFLGLDTLKPLLLACAKWNKSLFICLKNSNPGSVELQNIMVKNEPLYLYLAKKIARLGEEWGLPNDWSENLGIVVGGNFPQQAQEIRKILPKSPFLVPGFGAQKADTSRGKDFHFLLDPQLSPEEKTFYRGAIFPLSRGLAHPWLYANEETLHHPQKKESFIHNASKAEIAELLKKTAEKYRRDLC